MQDFCLENLDVSLDQGILDTHKGSFGHLLMASGDTGYGGAGIIASEAAIMSGCGLVTLITKKEHIQSSLSRNPEVIAISVDGRQDAETFLKDQKNLLIGPAKAAPKLAGHAWFVVVARPNRKSPSGAAEPQLRDHSTPLGGCRSSCNQVSGTATTMGHSCTRALDLWFRKRGA